MDVKPVEFQLSRIDRVYRHYDVTATLADGTPATLAGVDVALLAVHGKPTAATGWTPTAYTDGTATVLLAGPDADPTGAVPVQRKADLWIRVTDTPEVVATFVETIDLT